MRVMILLILLLPVAAAAARAQAPASTPCPPPGILDPAAYGDAGPQYPAPDLSVRCTDDTIIIESNGIPGFAPPRMTPNILAATPGIFRIPRRPREAATPSEVPFLGPIGVTVTGLPIFAPNEAGDLGHGDAYLDGILDACGGHVGPRGIYHFHARPGCPFDQARDLTTAVLGYGFDGYPIMAPYVCVDATCTGIRKVEGSWRACDPSGCTGEVRKVEGSWERANPEIRAAWEQHEYVPGLGDLDRCNGMVGPDGRYRYYATDSFPYNLGCYRGEVDPDDNRLMPGWSARATVNEPRLGPGRTGQPGGPGGPPDLAQAARMLGIGEQQLRQALGPPPPDLAAAAQRLGIDRNRLVEALEATRRAQ